MQLKHLVRRTFLIFAVLFLFNNCTGNLSSNPSSQNPESPTPTPDPTPTPTPTPPTPVPVKIEADCNTFRWIDVHSHCVSNVGITHTCVTPPCCDYSKWQLAKLKGGGGLSVMMSLEHYRTEEVNGETIPADILPNFNLPLSNTAKEEPTLFYFGSLGCWHDANFSAMDWVAKCKTDVDELIQAGAKGIKDHVGKQFDADDVNRWLGSWNRANGFCADALGDPTPNKSCMEQPTVKYPLMENNWRSVVKYIVETKKIPIVTHAATYTVSTENCYDPDISGLATCHSVTRKHLMNFADWAVAELSAEARKRIIVAHLGFLDDSFPTLELLLQKGLSVDTVRPITGFGVGGATACAIRDIFSRYPNQFIFGTDYKVAHNCIDKDTYDAWMHVWSGTFNQSLNFPTTCAGNINVRGLDLDTQSIPACGDNIPTDLLDKILRSNFLSLYGQTCD